VGESSESEEQEKVRWRVSGATRTLKHGPIPQVLLHPRLLPKKLSYFGEVA
jgi:hypothetical protein